MMLNKRAKGLRSPSGAILALVLAVTGVFLAALSFRVVAVHQLWPSSPSAPGFVRHDPRLVLSEAATDLVRLQGVLPPATLAAVRKAAAKAPLDANAYLVLGHQYLLDRNPDRARKTLEAGRRLDPRNRVIHLLLLDRYLREQRYADAATEFAVLSRLVGQAQGPIAAALAQMSQAPETRDAARRTLQTDPTLENSVLVTLARSDVPAVTVFDLASPTARRNAGDKNSWGLPLINRLVAHKQYAEARGVWQRIYGLTPAQSGALLYDAGLRGLPGSPPFNWTLTAGSLGAADMRNGTLSVEYYGRDSGYLASQLVVLRPGSYRFRFVVEGKTPGGVTLYWSLHCTNNAKIEPMHAVVNGSGPPRAIVANFTVPADCPAQTLTLTGEAGEFPVAINVTLRALDLAAAPGSRP
jgi:tetratricopeptide (TPR) repeat protein